MKNIQFTGFVFIFNSEFCSSQFQSSQIYYSIISQERKYLYSKKYDSQEDIAGAENKTKKKKTPSVLLSTDCFQLSISFLSYRKNVKYLCIEQSLVSLPSGQSWL